MGFVKCRGEVPAYVHTDSVAGLTLRAEQEQSIGLDGPKVTNTGRMHTIALLVGGGALILSTHEDEDTATKELNAWAERLGKVNALGNGR